MVRSRSARLAPSVACENSPHDPSRWEPKTTRAPSTAQRGWPSTVKSVVSLVRPPRDTSGIQMPLLALPPVRAVTATSVPSGETRAEV